MSQMPEDGSSPYGDLPYAMAGLRRKSSPYDRQRQYAYSLMQGGMDTSPIAHPMQGVSRLAQALVGSLMANRADSQEAEAQKAQQEAFGKAAQIADPNERLAAFAKLDPEMGMRFAAQSAMQEAAQRREIEGRNAGSSALANMYGMGGGGPQQAGGGPAAAIAGIESGGRYDAMGVEVPGQGRAHGKYQVMPANIGPWTKEILGTEMTPAQFLASPQAQDAVFQGKFGQYIRQYGSPEAAARAWFAGPGGMNNPNARDPLGTSVADYSAKFVRAGGNGPMQGPPQVAQGDNIPGPGAPPRIVLPQADGSGNPMAPQLPPGQTEIPKPEADPDVVRRAISLTQIPKSAGGITMGDAVKMIEQDRADRWKLAQQQAGDQRKLADQIAAEDRRAQAQVDRVAPEAFIKGAAENYSKNVRPKAENAVQDIMGIHQIRQLLDAGAFTGTGAEAKTYLSKLGEMVGLAPNEAAANTQVLSAQLANRVLAGMGGSLGSGFSNADRDFVEKAKGGQIAMTETALRRLMDIGERQARMTLDSHAREVERFSKVPELARMTGGQFFALPPAPNYAEWSKANPMPSVQPQQQGGQPQRQQGAAPPVQGARQAPDGNWYVPDPNRPGKYLMVR